MSTTVTLNGVAHAIPAIGESGWGDAVSNYLIALATGVLSKAGGSFTLTAEVDFGLTFGVKSAYLKSRATNPAGAGIVRLGNAEVVSWRNAANSANLDLTVSAANLLTFNSAPILTLALGAADTVLKMNAGGTAYEYGKIANANVDAAAAIAYSKLALTGAILNADLAGSIADTKLATISTAGKVANSATTATTAATADSIVARNGSGNIVSPTFVTPALGTPASGVLTNATGLPLASGVTGTLPVANGGTGVTSSTGSGNNVLSTSPTFVTPDLGTPASGVLTNATGLPLTTGVTGALPIANGGSSQTTANAALNAFLPSQATHATKALVTNGTSTSWSSVATDALTSAAVKVGNVSNVATAIDTSTVGDILANSTDGLNIKAGVIVNADVNASAAIAGSKLVAAATGVAGAVSATTQTMTGLKNFETGYYGNTACNYSASQAQAASTNSVSPTSWTTNVEGAYVTSTAASGGGGNSSTGTFTITFGRAASYLVLVDARMAHGAASTVSGLSIAFGGTATRYSQDSNLELRNATDTNNHSLSGMAIVIATVGQTVTINPVGSSTNVSGSHTINNRITVIPL